MPEIKHLAHQTEDGYFVQLIPDVQFARFANGQSLKMNILRPVSHLPLPLIVWVVGGAWVDIDPYKHIPALSKLARQGYVIACVEYRTVNKAPFPAQLEDIKTAIRFLRAHALDYHIDPEHIGIWGHSAGAHLSALVGVTGDQSEWDQQGQWQGYSSSVKAVVDFAGPIDIQADFQSEYELPVISLLMGGPLRHKIDTADQSNPIHHLASHIPAQVPPFLIMHGDQDQVVPLRQSQFLYDALAAMSAEVDLYILEGVGHSSTTFMTRNDVLEIVSEFFALHLKGS